MQTTTLWNRNFLLLCFSVLLTGMAFYFMLPTLPVYLASRLHMDSAAIGTMLGVFTIASLLVRPLSGWAIDRGSKKRLICGALFLFALPFLGYSHIVSALAMGTLRFFHGIAWGVTSTTSSSVVVDFIPPKQRGEGIGIFGLAMTLAMAFGPLVATSLFSMESYTTLFDCASILSLFAMFLAFGLHFEKKEPSATHKGIAAFVEQKAVPSSLNMMLFSMTYGGLLSFIALYGRELGIQNSGPFFLLFAVGLGISRVSAGRVFDKHGPRSIVSLGSLLLICGYSTLVLFANRWGFFGSAVALGFGMGILMPTFQAMVNNLILPNRRGAANSTFFTAWDLGIGVGMVGFGFLGKMIGLGNSFYVCAGVSVLAFALFWTWVLPHYHVAHAQHLEANKHTPETH